MNFNLLTRNFEQWALSSGIQVSPKVEIQDLRHLSQGRGLVANQDIEEDEILFRIPRNVLLNVETGSLSQINDNKEKLLTKYSHWEGLILTMIYELSLGENSKWYPYLKLLPEDFYSLMFWSNEELEFLRPSLVLTRIGKSEAKATFDKLFPNSLIDLGIPHVTVSLEMFHKVASRILSYSFDVERPDFVEDLEDDTQVKFDGYYKSMVALADLLNADTNHTNANLFYDPEFLVMKSTKKILPEEQIYNTYGDHPNSELLRRYGYVEWNGSKFDFGELPLETMKIVLSDHYDVSQEFLQKFLDLIPETDVDEIEEELVLDSFDVYIDGDVVPEAQVLLQSLVTLCEINKSENFENYSDELLTKTINRVLKKCYQLIESKTVTKATVTIWQHCIEKRLEDYPSHAFRNFIIPPPVEQLKKIKMSECILKSEVSSLQRGSSFFTSSFRIIDDDKIIRNVMKRKLQDNNTGNHKRQKI